MPNYNITTDEVYERLKPYTRLVTRSKRADNYVDTRLGKLGFPKPESVKAKEILVSFNKFPKV